MKILFRGGYCGSHKKPRRFVSAPCSACGVVHKLNELVRVGLNDRKVFICNACLDK